MLSGTAKNYMGVLTAYINCWVFYNKQMFEDYGVKTPKEYYDENNWTWENFKTVADSFVSKKSDGTIDTYGVSIYNNSFQASTGVELVERDETADYKFNLKSEPITKMMNFLYSMGKAGSNSLVVDSTTPGIDMFAQSKVAMCVTNNWVLTQAAWADLFANDKIDWICLPKMDAESSYYNELALSPTFGIANGSKNPQTAALAIEFHKWLNVGSPITSYLPTQENAASKKYKITFDTISDKLTKEQIEWTEELTKHPTVSIMWQSWLCQNGTVGAYPGINDVLLGKKWSEVVEAVYPSIDAMLKSNF